MIIVTDNGFKKSTDGENNILSLENTADAKDVLTQIEGIERIEVNFPSFADGRGFSLAKNLRRAGYKGHLRATGHLIADQYAHARRCGFDDVAISENDAERQPEKQWLEQVDHIDTTYQTRLLQASNVI